jgi:serine/threonine protein kinase
MFEVSRKQPSPTTVHFIKMTLTKSILLLLLAALSLAGLDPEIKSKIRDALSKRYSNLPEPNGKILMLSYMNVIEFELATRGYTITNYLGKGSYGIVIEAKNPEFKFEKLAIKIGHKDAVTEECGKNQILVENQHKESNHVIRMVTQFDLINKVRLGDYKSISQKSPAQSTDPIKQQGQPVEGEFKFCILVQEGAEQDLSKPLFTDKDTNKLINSRVLGYVLYKTLEGFARFNFQDQYLHGDIKEPNLVVVKSKEHKFEPRIIDFDLTCRLSKQEDEEIPACNTILTYTLYYRPPELRLFCPDNNCIDKYYDSDELRQEYLFSYYVYSSEYKEDAWALAITMNRIMEINENFIDAYDEFLIYLFEKIVPTMLGPHLIDRASTADAFDAAYEFISDRESFFDLGKLATRIATAVGPFQSSINKIREIEHTDESPAVDSSEDEVMKNLNRFGNENEELAQEFNAILNDSIEYASQSKISEPIFNNVRFSFQSPIPNFLTKSKLKGQGGDNDSVKTETSITLTPDNHFPNFVAQREISIDENDRVEYSAKALKNIMI